MGTEDFPFGIDALCYIYNAIFCIQMHTQTMFVEHDDVIKWKHFPRYCPVVREFSGHRWIPLTKASDGELGCFLWSEPEQTVE